MSSGCGDVLSLADLQTAKKHQIFEAEVITGKSGGVAGGADINYATNPVTGQVQKTLPAVLRDAGFSPVSWDFSTGGTLNDGDRGKVVYDPVSKTWYSYAGLFPVTVPAGFNPVGNADWMPQTDPSLSDRVDTLEGEISVLTDKTIDWVTPDQFKLPGAVDDTAAFTAALAASKRIKLMARTYYVNADTIVTSSDDVYIIGEGSAHTKIVANSTGAKLVGLDGLPGSPFTVRQRISIQGVTLDGNGMVTNTITTQASQSPRLAVDVVVTGAISHGFVHTRGWSTFAYGLVCTYNGGAGLYLVGDNNNTHWDGMWSHNTGIGVYVQNAAAVSFSGSFENNGEQGCLVDANATIASGYVNTESSVITFTDGCYFESNGQNAAGTYPELQFGGNGGGTVRDCSVSAAHIGVPLSGIGIQFNGSAKRVTVDCSGLYPVNTPTAFIRYSAAYTNLATVISADHKFINITVAANRILSLGFSDTDGELAAYVLGGGSQASSSQDKIIKATRLTDANNTGTYLERIYRGSELISERGVKPNVQVWNNAASAYGYHSFAIGGTEIFRLATTTLQPRLDNAVSLGTSGMRWSTVYAANGTINTSDETLKTPVITDAAREAIAASAIKSSIYSYKWTDGSDGDKVHFGVGAQTVEKILSDSGLNPDIYAFLFKEKDDEGKLTYGIRYNELIMFILKYM